MKTVLSLVALSLTLFAPDGSLAGRVRLISEEEILAARENLEEYAEARAILERLQESLQPWLECSLDDLWSLVPPPEVPRAFDTSFDGCPCHGRELYKGGFYPWLIDPWKKPWKITCPIGGAEYPSNDFAAFLATGMSDRSLITGPFGDDGWGVLVPGETKKRWFVAYYCHWFWLSHLIPAVRDLGRVYRLTGEEPYGSRCAVLLDRIADFYPRMDHNRQSRYAQEFVPSYTGKIVNRIWETGVLSDLAESYDAVRESLPSMGYSVAGARDPIAHPEERDSIVRNGTEIDRNIRENLLRVGLAGILGGETVRGNFGMHQRAALCIALALGDPETIDTVVQYVVDGNESLPEDALRYAFDNLFFREGVGFESAPGYCYTWTQNVLALCRLLHRLGVNLYEDRHLPKIAGAPGRMIIQEEFSPTIGDFGNAVSGLIRLAPGEAADIWERYGRPCEAWDLVAQKAYGASWFSSYDSLFRRPPDRENLEAASASESTGLRTDLYHDYGLAILRNRPEPCDVAATVYFGQAAGHGQNDRLNLELFAWGVKIIPDFGYPQFMSEEKQTFAWDRHTASHVVAEVDERQQERKDRGKLHLFGVTDDDFLSYVEASSEGCYPNRVATYRRGVAMVGEGSPVYLLDVFWIRGGRLHDYSIHAFDAPLAEMAGLEVISQPAGTLAGEDVPFGYLYDDPDLEKPDKTRSFGSYLGSGYSFLTDVRRGNPGRPFRLMWRGKEIGLHLSFLGDGLSDVALSRGRPPRRQENPLAVDFLRLREQSDGERMTMFLTLIHPFRKDPFVRGGRVFHRDEQGRQKIAVLHRDGEDIIDIMPGRWCRVERFSSSGRNGSWAVFAAGGDHTRVLQIDSALNRVAVSKQESTPCDSPRPGDTVIFRNADRTASFTIAAVEEESARWWIDLGDDRPVVGRIRVAQVKEDEGVIRSAWSLPLMVGGRYHGARLVSSDHKLSLRIIGGKGNDLRVEKAPELSTIQPGQTLFIEDFGPGDEAVFCQTRAASPSGKD